MNIEQLALPNFGYSISRFPDDVLLDIKSEIAEIKDNIINTPKISQQLAGHLENQFYLKKSKDILEPSIIELAINYTMFWKYQSRIYEYSRSAESPISFELESVWVNFQKKLEYNPLHNHTGLFSFVSWINIPYNVRNEMSLSLVMPSNGPVAASFNFVYTNVFGEVQNHPFFPEKVNEGDIIFFPAQLNHLVYPFFTSDDYRITISGNVFVKK